MAKDVHFGLVESMSEDRLALRRQVAELQSKLHNSELLLNAIAGVLDTTAGQRALADVLTPTEYAELLAYVGPPK